jgi:hypothetical protein
MVRTNLDVNADDGFGEMTRGIEAVVTKANAQLIFVLGAKAAVAFVAGGVLGPLKLFSYVNFRMDFRMDFRRDHNSSPMGRGKRCARRTCLFGIEDTALT